MLLVVPLPCYYGTLRSDGVFFVVKFQDNAVLSDMIHGL